MPNLRKPRQRFFKKGPPYTPPRPAEHGLTRDQILNLARFDPLATFFISRFTLFELEQEPPFLDRTDAEIRGAYQEWLDLQAAKEAAK